MPELFYVANVRLPTEKAHGIQIMKTCEALAAEGVALTLIIPRRHNPITEDPFSFYDCKKIFQIKRLPCIDIMSISGFGRVGFAIQSATFSFFLFFYVLTKRKESFLARNVSLAALLSLISRKIYLELHWLPAKQSLLYKIIFKRISGVILISLGLLHAVRARGMDGKRIVVIPDAVDVELFTNVPDQANCRKTLGLPPDKKIVLYTGHFYAWKGAGLVAQVAEELSEQVLVCLVGGTEADRKSFMEKYKAPNLFFPGWKSPQEIPLWLSAADVLVLPTSARDDIGRLYTSPLKLYEYIASAKTIVASDVPSNRDVLEEDKAVYFSPDSVEDLKRALRVALQKNTPPRVVTNELEKYSWH